MTLRADSIADSFEVATKSLSLLNQLSWRFAYWRVLKTSSSFTRSRVDWPLKNFLISLMPIA